MDVLGLVLDIGLALVWLVHSVVLSDSTSHPGGSGAKLLEPSGIGSDCAHLHTTQHNNNAKREWES